MPSVPCQDCSRRRLKVLWDGVEEGGIHRSHGRPGRISDGGGSQERKIGAPSMPKACFDEGEHGFHPHIIIFTLINLFLSRPLTAQFGERGAPPPSVFPLLTTRFYGLSVPRPFLSSFDHSILRPQCAPTFAVACCAGQGCCFTSIHGSGMSWVNAGGAVFMKTLADGEQVESLLPHLEPQK